MGLNHCIIVMVIGSNYKGLSTIEVTSEPIGMTS